MTWLFGLFGESMDFMAHHEHLPICADVIMLSVGIECAVASVSRYHKYASGAELRRSAMQLLGLVVRAARASAQRVIELERLVLTAKQIKALARELKVFESFTILAGLAALSVVISVGLGVQELLFACGTRWRIDRPATPGAGLIELSGRAARRRYQLWRAANISFAVLTKHQYQRDGRRTRVFLRPVFYGDATQGLAPQDMQS